MKTIKILFLLIFPFCAYGQFAETIVSGRPGQSNGPFGVGKGVAQIQSGLRYNRWKFPFGSGQFTNQIFDHSSVLRIGIFEKLELRGGIQHNLIKLIGVKDVLNFQQEETQVILNEISSVNFGIRQNLISQNGLIPAIGIQATALIGGNKSYKTEGAKYRIRLLLQHKILQKLTLNTNFSNTLESETIDYTFSLSYPVTKKTRVVAEYFGSYFHNTPIVDYRFQNSFDVGVGHLIGDNFQIDLFAGYRDLYANISEAFVSTGVSYRIHKREK